MRKLNINWFDLELAFESPPDEFSDPFHSRLDVETGRVITILEEERSFLEKIYEEIYQSRPEDYAASHDDITSSETFHDLPDWQKKLVLDAFEIDRGSTERFVSIPRFESGDSYRMMEDFIETLKDARFRDRLSQAIGGRKPFRRFKDLLASDRELQHYWYDFKRRKQRESMLEWLASIGVEPADKLAARLEPRPLPPVRKYLLSETLWFVREARKVSGVVRIALIGSLTTDKVYPKDTDLLVTVEDDTDLAPLATLGRKLGGHLQAHNLGGEVFLADPGGHHIGRTCHWKECGPGIRASCDALHCGLRKYLHDDLRTVRLNQTLIAHPPLVLWPRIATNIAVPQDVQDQLIRPLEEEQIM